MQIAVIRMFV